MPYAIETENLGRIYKIRGSKKEKKIRKELIALQEVNLQIEQGELFGLLGPNGAGKTTLINAVCGIVTPTTGQITAAGYDTPTDVQAQTIPPALQGLDLRVCSNTGSGTAPWSSTTM